MDVSARCFLKLLFGEKFLIIFVRNLVLSLCIDISDRLLDDAKFFDDLLDITLLDEFVKKMHFFVDIDHLDS